MASTITELAVNQSIMTDKCLDEFFEGQFATAAISAAGRYKLVLLNLALGSVALTQATTAFWSDISAAETNTKSDGVTATPLGYTKGTGITLTGANLTAISAHAKAFDVGNVSIDNADFKTDAYAIVRDTGNPATSPVLMLGKWDVAKIPSGTGVANFTSTIVSPIKITAGAAA